MNLIVPVNLQALRVSPNDASLITKQSDLFAGPTTSFEELPWRDPSYTDHPGRLSRANLSANVLNPLSGGVVEQLDTGVHLHWALPDGLTRGVQQADGALAFPAVPNRWLVTRILTRGGQVAARQWVVESDRLMTEDEYTGTYFPASGRKSTAVPVGWSLIAGNDPQRDGGALYYPPSRRLGRVFELGSWQPAATPAGAAPDQVLHLDALTRQATAFTQGRPPGPLKAVGASGPAFAAYYPDSRGAFGFHDRFDDLVAAGTDLGNAAFQVSYVVVGWHSHTSDDPLRTPLFTDALAKATQANAAAPPARQADAAALRAGAVSDTYRWHYDPAAGSPDRCLYHAQATGVAWDTTVDPPGGDPRYPKCFLQPPADDPTVRLAVGGSSASAVAALIKREWVDWVAAAWAPADGQAPDIPEQIEKDLEFLIEALQLGLLHGLGGETSLPLLEQALHQSGFGALPGGQAWTVAPKASAADPADPQRFTPPEEQLPDDDNDLAGKLATLNGCQTRLEALLATVDSVRRQVFLDWYHYITAVGSGQADDATNALKDGLKTYISGQIADLWAKLDAAFGQSTAPGAATGNLPVYWSDAGTYLTVQNGRYASPSPAATLAGQIATAANAILDVLAKDGYADFELRRVERARFWQPNEPVVVATGDGLTPAQRNGTARVLPCRLPAQIIPALTAETGTTTKTSAKLAAADAADAVGLAVPALAANTTPEAGDTRPLLADVQALLGEACVMDAGLAPLLAGKLTGITGPTLAADLQAALRAAAAQIAGAWRAGAKEGDPAAMPAVLTDVTAAGGALSVTLPGQAPQGVALTAPAGAAWDDPFLPLFLAWEVSWQPFEKGATAGAATYDAGVITGRFGLDENTIDLVLTGDPPKAVGGAAALHGHIPLSSRAAEPLIDQIRQYIDAYPDENPELKQVIDHLTGKPLLSQGLGGVNPALLSRAPGMQLTVFNPFYDTEAPATGLGAGTDTLDYANVLTHFAGWAAGALADQVPLGTAGFNPLRAGYLGVVRADVVDVFGRKRRVIDSTVAADAGKVTVATPLLPPAGSGAQIALPPRLAQPARLLFEWVSGNDARYVTNAHPSTSPVTGWVVANHLDNSLMLFAPSGRPLGSLGVFGGQTTVAWQSPAGRPARSMDDDLAGDELTHFRKFATFIHGQSRAFFDALGTAIEEAHTYILADNGGGEQPYAVLMGRPLALVRAELRLELAGLPAANATLTAVQAAMAANGTGPYDWTRRDDAGLRAVNVPVRLGDRNHLSDGLVGYLIDGPDAYDTLYAPAATAATGTGVRRPAPDTLCLTPRPALDPPAAPYPGAAQQTAALRDATARSIRTAVTLLIDPRASVHATTGILPVKAIDLPAETYARALRSIEVSFFTHPVLRGAQGLELPIPDEAGFQWRWTMGVKQDGTAQPQVEALPAPRTGDRAHFRYSPQLAQDGWLTLVPQPPQPPQPPQS